MKKKKEIKHLSMNKKCDIYMYIDAINMQLITLLISGMKLSNANPTENTIKK